MKDKRLGLAINEVFLEFQNLLIVMIRVAVDIDLVTMDLRKAGSPDEND